ncbi:hypothetical protein PIB30_038664 [Stylosanthes scabra]|uniref:Uncharacterized protein n=1 Tax=Stylosanthes scabra TaxID=79078 RepID=A0ABU6YCG4_9FABA|nr:hypothetical protein [Stylosanthes scabra]
MCTCPLTLRDPGRIEAWVDEAITSAGFGFQMGLIVGSPFHFFKSLCNSPTHIAAACNAVRLNAPRVGGKVAAWFVLYSASHYALMSARHRDDPWNRVFAPAISSGLLSLCHRSVRASARFAVFGGVLGAAQEVGIIMASKFLDDRKHQKTMRDFNKSLAKGT